MAVFAFTSEQAGDILAWLLSPVGQPVMILIGVVIVVFGGLALFRSPQRGPL